MVKMGQLGSEHSGLDIIEPTVYAYEAMGGVIGAADIGKRPDFLS